MPRMWCTDPKKIAEKGDILISVRAPIGAINIANEQCCIGRGVAAIRPNAELISKDFLRHQLCASRNKLEAMGTGSTFKAIGKKALNDLAIAIYPKREQEAIACQFNWVAEQIKVANSQLALLDTLVKSRFVEMFGEPTTRCGRWPLVRLDSFAQVVTGNTPSRKNPEYYGEGIEWVKTDNIVNSAITASAEQLTETGRAKARIAPAGSILMACIAGSVNSIGKVGLLDREAAFNQQINAIVPSCGVNSRFLLTMLTLSKDYLCSDVNQQLKGILNKTALSAKQFPLPPFELQQQFASFVARVDKSGFVCH